MQYKHLIIIQNLEDFSDQNFYAFSKLQQQSCNRAITNKPEPTLESVRVTFIKKGFMLKDLRSVTLVSALRDEKKNYYIGLTKSAGQIKVFVDKSVYLLVNNKSAAKIQAFLESRFQYIFPISITRIFCVACNIKFSDCKDVMNYTGRYYVAFDKIKSLIRQNSEMSKKTVKIAL